MFQVRFLLWVVLLMGVAPVAGWAQTETPAVANKRLFDRTVEELNFRTMETVYDKTFTRRKFPVSLRTQQQRKQFDDFNGNAELKKLFLNYNDISERFKSRFGKGRTDLAEFERQLNGLLIDKNFEFFIRVIPRDERIALIRAEQRIIKQATAQFNASQDPTPDELAVDAATVPPADGTALPSGDAAELEDVAPQPEVVAPSSGGPIIRSAEVPSSHDWFDYLTLLLALGSSLGLLYVLTSVLPEMRARLNELDPTHATRSSDPLPSDRYEDE